jgi:hypothetical protein
MNAVPVWLGEQLAGLVKCEGMLRDEGDDLVLEYQTKEALFGGVLKTKVQEARIPREILSSVRLEKTWFGLRTRLVIQSSRMAPVDHVPGMSRGRLVLRVAARDRAAAEQLVAALRLPASDAAKPAAFGTGLE